MATAPNEYGIIKGPSAPLAYDVGNLGDLTDIETYRHGHPVDTYKKMRTQAPVYWHPEAFDFEPGFWAITKHEDVVAVSKNPQLFSSQTGGHQITYGDPKLIDPAFTAAVLGNMIALDPPVHQTYRKMAAPAFTPKALGDLKANIDLRIDQILDKAEAKAQTGAPIDFVTDIAEMLPVYTLADLLGVPDADRPKLLEWTNKLIAAYDPNSPYLEGTDCATLTNMTGMEMFQYGAWLMAEKKKNPTGDLMSVMAHAEPDGEPVPEMYLNGFFLLLVIAGNETTRNTLSGMMALLSRNEDQRQILLGDLPGRIKNAVQEGLRLVSPVIHFRRTATADTQIRGQQIKAGDKVVMWYGAANRDSDVFDDSEAFDVLRANANKQLSFGIGEHFCLGSKLGEMQIEMMYARLLTRFPNIKMTDEPDYVGSNFISGITSLPVSLTGD